MKVFYETIAYCIAMALLLTTGTSAAEEGYIISKKDDETLLSLTIVFFVVCAVFMLICVVAAVALLRRVRSRGGNADYQLEEREERYQSMYVGQSNGLYDAPPSHYQSLKRGDSSSGVYQSVNGNGTNGLLNGKSKTKEVTPPGTEKGQKDSRESEKRMTLSSFQNPAYDSSTPYGLDKEVEFTPNSDDYDNDTAL